MSKWDKRLNEEPQKRTPKFAAAVKISPGYDISKVLSKERFLWPYHDLLIRGLKDHFVRQNEALLRSYNSDAVDNLLAAPSMQSFVDAGIAFAGYESVSLYYNDTNPINEMWEITTPVLVLNAADDPCCNIQNLYEKSPYQQHKGKSYLDMIQEAKRTILAVTHTGSHCPFLCSRNRWLPLTKDPLSGGWMIRNWADEVTIDYFRATIEVYGR